MWSWSNISLIYLRELRDQLRDRRTMLTVVVLPMLLYPLMGSVFMQVSQFMREHPTQILILGAEHLPETPALIDGTAFAAEVCPLHEIALLKLTLNNEHNSASAENIQKFAEAELQAGHYDAILYVPPDFAKHFNAVRVALKTETTATVEAIPKPHVFTNTAIDKARIASLRVDAVLHNWRRLIVQENLQETSVPEVVTHPFEISQTDVASPTSKRAAVWSKIMPFVLLVWALTGAFYPAIDICAGEKERGTLETLLCSPALRTEIVWGKLLTVMTFSMATAILNMLGMGITGWFIVQQMQNSHLMGVESQFGAPPLSALAWLLLALPPMSALFSALALAISTFARSSKEGQYYLMPLLMVMLPLMTLPMLPAAELDLGMSLIPVAGLMLLLRSLMEGHYGDVLRYILPVIAVTGTCCWLSIRWAIDQFNKESVLFRENEPFGLSLWLRHLMRDRGDTPNVAEAMLCAVGLLIIGFFAKLFATLPATWEDFAKQTVVSLIAFIATPALLMAIVLTKKPLKTLLLQRPSFLMTIPAAAVLAMLLHPAAMWLSQAIQLVYPISEDTFAALKPLAQLMQKAPLWQTLLVIALAPAICEELAFRGFILSGLRHVGNKWRAIAITALFFGVTHGILQQSIAAAAVGLVLGYLAVKTGSLLPAMTYHFTHNALTMIIQKVDHALVKEHPTLQLIFQSFTETEGALYTPWFSAFAVCLGAALILWFKSLPYEATQEEKLSAVLDRELQSLPLPVAAK